VASSGGSGGSGSGGGSGGGGSTPGSPGRLSSGPGQPARVKPRVLPRSAPLTSVFPSPGQEHKVQLLSVCRAEPLVPADPAVLGQLLTIRPEDELGQCCCVCVRPRNLPALGSVLAFTTSSVTHLRPLTPGPCPHCTLFLVVCSEPQLRLFSDERCTVSSSHAGEVPAVVINNAILRQVLMHAV
jgi:hypothetical protein